MTDECRPLEGAPDGTTFLLSHPDMRRPLRWVWISGAWALDRRGPHFPPADMHEWGWRIVTPPERGKEEDLLIAMQAFGSYMEQTPAGNLRDAVAAALAAVAPLIAEREREACAKLVEEFPARTHGSLATAPYAAAEQAAEEIAAAIRARKP